MACIAKRRNKWVVDYRIGTKRYYPSFSTKSEAEAFLRELRLRKVDSKTGFIPLVEKTLEVAVREYLTTITPQKSERTFEVDSIALTELVRAFPRSFVQDVSPREIEMYQVQLKSKFQPATVNRRFNVIRNFFKKCVVWRYCIESPTQSLKRLPEPPVERATLSALEISTAYDVLPDWAKDPFLLISQTSVRRNEAIKLEWSRVNFDLRTITFFSKKGGVHRRKDIPMTTQVFEMLLKLWNQREKSLVKSKFVFLNNQHSPINPVSFSSTVCKRGREAGIQNAGNQILRRTLMTEMSENNQSGSVIQKIAGHSSLNTTQRYLHHSSEVLRDALESVAEQRKETILKSNSVKRGC